MKRLLLIGGIVVGSLLIFSAISAPLRALSTAIHACTVLGSEEMQDPRILGAVVGEVVIPLILGLVMLALGASLVVFCVQRLPAPPPPLPKTAKASFDC